MTAEPVTNPPHNCPGRCGALVPHGHVACETCWCQLPAALQKRIANGDQDTRLSAVSEALVWYRKNVRGGSSA